MPTQQTTTTATTDTTATGMVAATHPGKNIREVERAIVETSPLIDGMILEYILSYVIEGSGEDVSVDALIEFVGPLLDDCGDGPGNDVVASVCRRVAALCSGMLGDGSGEPKRLAAEVSLGRALGGSGGGPGNAGSGVKLPGTGTDLLHTAGRNGARASTVDGARLQRQHDQAARKAARRAEGGDQPATKSWEKNPSLIVNQANSVFKDGLKDVKVDNFDISYAGRPILKNAALQLNQARRYGLVGRNGIGKSTLLKAIATKELRIPNGISFLHVEQEIQAEDITAIQSVLLADTLRESLIQEERRLSIRLTKLTVNSDEYNKSSKRLQEVYLKLEEIEAEKAVSKVGALLSGLGFSPEQQQAATKTFSGGWRMRLSLARALYCNPDLLLLDEVTNYLDMPSVVWLERYLCTMSGTMLIVSHDRSFLDAVATDIIHLHSLGLHSYRGNFSQFAQTIAERHKNQVKEYESQLGYRQHLQGFIDRFRYNAKRAPQAQSKMKILEKLPELKPPSKEEYDGLLLAEENKTPVMFTFNEAENLSPPILQMSDVSFKYPGTDKVILDNISLDLQMDSKIAIVGPNGAGKSTLIYLLTEKNAPTKGLVQRHGRLRVALFSQHHVDGLNLDQSPAEWLASMYPSLKDDEYRKFLGRFGVTGMTQMQPIGTLSGGQKSRVVFAGMAMGNPHVLVLDEVRFFNLLTTILPTPTLTKPLRTILADQSLRHAIHQRPLSLPPDLQRRCPHRIPRREIRRRRLL